MYTRLVALRIALRHGEDQRTPCAEQIGCWILPMVDQKLSSGWLGLSQGVQKGASWAMFWFLYSWFFIVVGLQISCTKTITLPNLFPFVPLGHKKWVKLATNLTSRINLVVKMTEEFCASLTDFHCALAQSVTSLLYPSFFSLSRSATLWRPSINIAVTSRSAKFLQESEGEKAPVIITYYNKEICRHIVQVVSGLVEILRIPLI